MNERLIPVRQTWAAILALVLASILSCALVVVRAYYAGTTAYLFFFWNLFVACVEFGAQLGHVRIGGRERVGQARAQLGLAVLPGQQVRFQRRDLRVAPRQGFPKVHALAIEDFTALFGPRQEFAPGCQGFLERGDAIRAREQLVFETRDVRTLDGQPFFRRLQGLQVRSQLLAQLRGLRVGTGHGHAAFGIGDA